MAVTYEFTGTRDFNRALERWLERAELASREALVAAGAEVARETKNSFGSEGGPNIVTGRLADAVTTTDPYPVDPRGWEIRVGPAGLDYVRRVELGKSGARSAPAYPYFQPGFKRAGERFVQIFTDAWTNALPRR